MTSLWDHEFDRQMKKEPELQSFSSELKVQDPLNPRDALYGGRTNATHFNCCEWDMQYVDVCSMYPYVLKSNRFPGSPRNHHSGFPGRSFLF